MTTRGAKCRSSATTIRRDVLVVLQVGVAKARVPPLGDAQDLRGARGLCRSQLWAAAGARFAGGQIQNTGPVSRVLRLEQRAGAGELDVVPVGGDGQQIDGHEDRSGEEKGRSVKREK